MKILVNIPLSPYSGYGRDGLGFVKSLLKLGHDVRVTPAAVQAPLPTEIAHLLTLPVEGPFDLAVSHVDPGNLVSYPGLRESSKVYVGWTMWEYTDMTNTPKYDTLPQRMQDFDALFGYDQNTVDGFKKAIPDADVYLLQGGYDPEDWAYMPDRDWDSDEFYFCMLGVLSERKSPFTSIHAFSAAKEMDAEFNKHARLSLKTQQMGLHPAMEQVYPGLRIYYEIWDHPTVLEFYKTHHVLLAPSRGEGKNLPALEFMSTGGSVIATNWGGHIQWMDKELAYPLDYSLKAFDPKYPQVFQAEASVEHMTELMLHTFHNRDEVRRKGELASQAIPARHSWDTVTQQFLDMAMSIERSS